MKLAVTVAHGMASAVLLGVAVVALLALWILISWANVIVVVPAAFLVVGAAFFVVTAGIVLFGREPDLQAHEHWMASVSGVLLSALLAVVLRSHLDWQPPETLLLLAVVLAALGTAVRSNRHQSATP